MATVTMNLSDEDMETIRAEVRAEIEGRAVKFEAESIVGYGILVRHPGMIDRMLPAEPYAYYQADSINHWLCGPDRESMCLETEQAAQSLADELAARFGGEKYRFTVAVRRLVPRWFILEPKRESEHVVIGSREQIL